ncbi:VOC family protein [Crossiella sp. NPDC003009]
MSEPAHGMLHHVELWVPDLRRAVGSFGWLLEALGYREFQRWDGGRSWRLGSTYVVLEQSPALTADRHDRCRPGLNHLAFHVEDAAAVDRLTAEAGRHGWTLLFPERHPHAGGARTYAAYWENEDGFEVELVAPGPPEPQPPERAV